MEKLMLYIVSGCCGVGKTTITRELAKLIPQTALVSGDNIHDLFRDMSATWEQRLKITWQNILLVLDNFLSNNINVIIDYVVEDELPQILRISGKYNIEVRYIVLTADKTLIRRRLEARGDAYLVERAMYLHNKLAVDKSNIPFLYDGTNISIEQQIKDIKAFRLYTL